jgi:hypothetical protein
MRGSSATMPFAYVHNSTITSRNNGYEENESSSLSQTTTTTSVVEMTTGNTSSQFWSHQTPVSAHDNNNEPDATSTVAAAVGATTSNLHDDDDEEEEEEEETLEIISSHDMDLSMLQAATLLTADCMGTGLLALPQDIQVLGVTYGFMALIVNLPVAWYAGFLLSQTAIRVEQQGKLYRDDAAADDDDSEQQEDAGDDDRDHGGARMPTGDGLVRVVVASAAKKTAYSSIGKAENEKSTATVVVDHDNNTPLPYDDSNNTHDYIGITREV